MIHHERFYHARYTPKPGTVKTMLREHVARLPALEQDILRLHLDLKRTHSDIARILGMSQPAVNYRYKRARERLAVWELLPSVTPYEVQAVMQERGARETDITAMMLYVETNNQSEVARRMNTNQGFVRNALLRGLVQHLQNDLSHEDRHVRVRQACSILVNKPGMFNDVNNTAIGHVAKSREITRKIVIPPRLSHRPLEGIGVEIEDGLYKNLFGTVETVEPIVTLKLDVLSQDIRLQWPGQVEIG